jgi:hypothetical protein
MEAGSSSFYSAQGGREVCGEGDSIAAAPARDRARRRQGEVGDLKAVLGRSLARWGTAWRASAMASSGDTGAGNRRGGRRRKAARGHGSVSGGLLPSRGACVRRERARGAPGRRRTCPLCGVQGVPMRTLARSGRRGRVPFPAVAGRSPTRAEVGWFSMV